MQGLATDIEDDGAAGNRTAAGRGLDETSKVTRLAVLPTKSGVATSVIMGGAWATVTVWPAEILEV